MSTTLSVTLCVLALLATPLCRCHAAPAPPLHFEDDEENLEEALYNPDAPQFGGLSRPEIAKLLLEHEHQSEKLAEAERAILLDWLSSRFNHQQVPPSLPIPQQLTQALPLLGAKHNLIGSDSEPLEDKEKRGSYMSLCHFKICNMGRKRNLRTANPWIRQ